MATEDVRRVVEAFDGGGLQLRHFVEAAVGEVLTSNFTQHAASLATQVRALVPTFSEREAEIVVAAAAAATRHVSFLHQTLEVLRRSGDHSAAAERDLTRRLAYLAIGPRWGIGSGDASQPGGSSGPPSISGAAAQAGTDSVRQWLAAADPAAVTQAAVGRPQPLPSAGGLELMELDVRVPSSPSPPPRSDDRPASVAARPCRTPERRDDRDRDRDRRRRSASRGHRRVQSRERDRPRDASKDYERRPR